MSNQPLADLTASLRHLHRHAGEPSTREIGKAIGYSHTTVAQALAGSRRCSWKVLEHIVLYLGGDLEAVKQLWIAVRDVEDPLPPLPARRTPPAEADSVAVDRVPSDDQHQRSSPIAQKDDRVEIIVDPFTRNRRFFVPPAIAREWIMDLEQEEPSDDE